MANRDSDLQRCFATAARRMRLQRLVDTGGWAVRLAALGIVVFLAAMLIFPSLAAWGLGALSVAGLVAVLAFAAVWCWPLDAGRISREIDRHFDLPDHVVSAHEFGRDEGTPWFALQRADTARRLAGLDWAGSWPIFWPRFSGLFGVATAFLALLMVARFMAYAPVPIVSAASTNNPAAAAIEEIFKDWEKAAEKTEDPELRKLLAEIKPMRDQMPKMSDRELMMSLSKLENKLQALREAAAKDSLEEASGELASAFENVEDMGALAAALRRKDFERAAEMSQKEAEKLAKADAAPRGADSTATQQQMEQASQKLEKSGQKSAASALQQVKQAGQKNDGKGMGKGMEQLAKGFGNEAKRQSAAASLGVQLAQIGQGKGQIGQKPGEGEGQGQSTMPKLSDRPGGREAGSETDPNRTKTATNLEAGRTAQNLTGAAGEGESQTENLKSDTPGGEAPRGERSAQFSQYEKLSQQAIADENLPLAYRESIRKYFEAIRPSKEK